MGERQPSGWAAGWISFAAAMLGLIGFFEFFAGVAGVTNDELYLRSPDWIFQFDAATWGWIHIALSIVLMLSAIGLMVGNVLARSVGVVVAMISAVTNFAFLPTYPVWAVVMIAVNICVIWALTIHGRDAVTQT